MTTTACHAAACMHESNRHDHDFISFMHPRPAEHDRDPAPAPTGVPVHFESGGALLLSGACLHEVAADEAVLHGRLLRKEEAL